MNRDEMTDMGSPKPRRANPLQPDRPVGADGTQDQGSAKGDAKQGAKATEKLEQQENSAIENVNEGYGKG